MATAMKVLLDTNAYSFLAAGNKDIYQLAKHAETVFMSTIVLGELYAGFARGSKKRKNHVLLDAFLADSNVRILKVSQETSKLYGLILTELFEKGRPTPTNDIWIAAHVRETGALLITYDNHFKEISDIRTADLLT